LFSFLISADYQKQIQDLNLQQVIGGSQAVLNAAQLAAQAEAKSYLVQKYDTATAFLPTVLSDITKTYKAGATVYDSSNNFYNAVFPQPQFDYQSIYNIGDQVFWKDKTYTCLIATGFLSHADALEIGQITDSPILNIFPDDIINGPANWGPGTSYSVPANTALTNTTYWTPGDNRDQMFVMILIDLTLYHVHSRIAPRNIPDLRVKRYDEAIKWLKECARGKDITPDLPLLQPKSGSRIRFGGNVKNVTQY
jgi:phage gp36-like protein